MDNQFNGLRLPTEDCRLPQLTRGSEVVELKPTALRPEGLRLSRATVVRVVLNKLETLDNTYLSSQGTFILGRPEQVLLVPGDRFEVRSWHQNNCTFATLVGFRCDIPFSSFLEDRKLELSEGNHYGAESVDISGDGGRLLWGAKIASKEKIGGVKLTGRVKPGMGPLTVKVWGIAKAVTGGSGYTEVGWQDPGPHIRRHQQCQSYGDYEGQIEAVAGRTFKIAAPGSPGYLGGSTSDFDKKRACYWTPLRLRLHASGAVPRKVIVSPGDSKEPFSLVQFGTAKAVRLWIRNREPAPVQVSADFQQGMEVSVVYVGGAATASNLRFE